MVRLQSEQITVHHLSDCVQRLGNRWSRFTCSSVHLSPVCIAFLARRTAIYCLHACGRWAMKGLQHLPHTTQTSFLTGNKTRVQLFYYLTAQTGEGEFSSAANWKSGSEWYLAPGQVEPSGKSCICCGLNWTRSDGRREIKLALHFLTSVNICVALIHADKQKFAKNNRRVHSQS